MVKPAGLIIYVGFLWAGIFHVSEGAVSGDFALQLFITNQKFETSLLNPLSEDYKTLESEVVDLVNSIYGCTDCMTKSFYSGASDVTFSQGGSLVAVTLELSFSINIDSQVVQDIFNSQYLHLHSPQLQIDVANTKVVPVGV